MSLIQTLATLGPPVLKAIDQIVGVIRDSPDPKRTAERLAKIALHEASLDQAMRHTPVRKVKSNG